MLSPENVLLNNWLNKINSSLLNTEEIERKRRRLTDERDFSEKSFSDFGAQVYLPDPTHEMLVKRIDELENLNRRLLSENEVLRGQLLYDQQDRVKFVMEIAKRERGNVYNDITSLFSF